MGETHSGGYSQKARVNGDWLVKLPALFSRAEAMAIGTAGYTAALAVEALVAAGADARQGAGGGDGRGRRRRLGRHRAAGEGRLQRHRLDRPRAGGRLPQAPRRDGNPRPGDASAPAKPLGEGALDRRRRQRRFAHARQSPFPDALRRGGIAACGLAGGMDLADLGRAVHPARRPLARHPNFWTRMFNEPPRSTLGYAQVHEDKPISMQRAPATLRPEIPATPISAQCGDQLGEGCTKSCPAFPRWRI